MNLTGFMILVWEGVCTITQIVIKQAATVILMPILKDNKKAAEIRKIQFL